MVVPSKKDSMEAIPPRSSNARLIDEDDLNSDESRNTFTPASTNKLELEDKEEVKSPAE